MSVSVLSLLLIPALAPAAASAQIKEGVSCGTELDTSKITSGTATDCGSANGSDAETTIGRIVRLVINIFSWVVGLVAVIMIIVGGLKYITSGGDSGNVSGAKNTILFAVVGLIVVLLAQIVVKFVVTKVTSAQ